MPAHAQSAAGAGSPAVRNLPFPLSAPPGFHVDLVSSRVDGARFIAVAPNGDILVAELSRGDVVAVHPDAPPDAQPTLVARGLPRPNAVAFRGNDLYIAVWTGVVVIADYPRGIGSPRVLFDDMPRNGDHNARALALDPNGEIFISSGSDCNVCREDDPRLATILHYGPDGRGSRIHASGLRNASGLAFDARGRLWAVVNQRDNLEPDHTDLPPDELDLIQQGGNYGWPTTYPIGDKRLPNPEFPGASTKAILPTTLNIQAHSAPLQAVFYNASRFPDRFRGALFTAFHGSWNRNPPTGYKVVAVIFQDGAPVKVEDFLTGWLTSDFRVRGRPVGVAVAADGSLYVSDDTGYLFRVRYGE
jgi:glucose/arabinose dehydrogenase